MHIKLNNTKNTRSLSDLTNKNGLKIKKHLLIRSDALNKIDADDQRILTEEYHLKRIIDLRCNNEVKNNPDVSISGIQIILNPILPSDRVGVTKKGNDEEDFRDFIEAIHTNGADSSVRFMTKVYQEVVASLFSTQAYQKFLRILLEDAGGATLWHCSAGKDRAGFATMILLYALDFDMKTIVEDYLSTNHYYQGNIEHFVKECGEGYRDVLETIFGVRKEYVDVLFDSIKNMYGSFDAYLEKGLLFSKQDKEKLQAMYLEER
ncbi:MAG: tyrosine-protein phosphatase [Anaeroplasmataceae bacterium]|nr:tyrosine-protein phosphatase [Anaeroplasmataceae bacterium]MDE6414570.1 tyrosine-protein phosphatase [Anaeroplasmataceae bacterium]